MSTGMEAGKHTKNSSTESLNQGSPSQRPAEERKQARQDNREWCGLRHPERKRLLHSRRVSPRAGG